MSQRALVIGGSGFVGSHLVDELVRHEWSVTVLDRDPLYQTHDAVELIRSDVADSRSVASAVSHVDVVFYLAWNSIHETSLQDPAADLRANLMPLVETVGLCRDGSPRRFVFVSSGGAVYGRTETLPIPEDHPCRPLSPYGAAKLAAEGYVRQLADSDALEFVIVRPSVPFGPRQRLDRRQGAVTVFLDRIARDLSITIWGDGSNSRDYFYVQDLAVALRLAGSAPLGPDPVYNIGGGTGVTLNELVARVERVTRRTARLEYGPARAYDPPAVVLDTTRVRRDLRWEPLVSFDDGIARTWAWLRARSSPRS